MAKRLLMSDDSLVHSHPQFFCCCFLHDQLQYMLCKMDTLRSDYTKLSKLIKSNFHSQVPSLYWLPTLYLNTHSPCQMLSDLLPVSVCLEIGFPLAMLMINI